MDMGEKIIEMVSDHPWPYEWAQVEVFGMHVTLVSSGIVSMVATALLLMLFTLPIARRHRDLPAGPANILEVLVIFVRDMIARPALGPRSYQYLPFLLTLFVYVLGLNLMGMVPFEAVSHLIPRVPLMGHTATSIPTVCAGLAALVLLKIVHAGWENQARRYHQQHSSRGWVAAWTVAPALWFHSLSPEVPGMIGKLLAVPLALLELLGAIAKCFSLMVRLCANMLSGHTLLAILLLFVFMTVNAYVDARQPHVLYVGPMVILGSVAVNILELLVAGLQAYIFTFLTAMFLGLYSTGGHH